MDGQYPAGDYPEGASPAEACGRHQLKTGLVMRMGYSRQWVVDTLRRIGYPEAADEALRIFPDEINLEQLQEFGDRHHISRDELVSRMGGSP